MAPTVKSGLKLAYVASILVSAVTMARAEADFYKGKEIKLIVSATVGGGYDVYARTLASGVICLLQNTVAFEPFYANKQALFDAAKLSWLGTPTTEVAMYIVWHTSKIKTLQDAQTQEMMAGGAGAASTPAFYGRLFNQIFNMKARLITGYPGQNEILLAMENGEVEAMTSPFWSSIKTSRPNWYPESKIRLLFQYGAEPHPELKGVPFALDLLRIEADKTLLIAASAPLGLGRPFVAPPGVPGDQLAILRTAMMATFNDPQFRADCEKQRLECSNPRSGEQIENLITQAYATTENVRKRLIDIYQVGIGADKK